MIKKVYKIQDIKEKILHAIDTITDPIASTLSPKGSNVIYEDDRGNIFCTNDGKTIAENLTVKDEVENAVIEIIKVAAKKTNIEAGDGTSSTVVASSVLVKEGFRLIENGHNRMEVRDELIKFSSDIQAVLKKKAVKVKNDNDLKLIAKISASNDQEIADNIVKIVKVAGLDGQVMIQNSYRPETEIIEDTGFVLKSGAFAEELVNKEFKTLMTEVPVLITDKRLYYKPEAETILKTVLDAGYKEVVIIAQDFIGEALPYFIANHINDNVKVILIAEKKPEILEDLATYLGGEVISDKKGGLVDKITIDDFTLATKVFADQFKSIISRDKNEGNKLLARRVKSLKAEMKKIGNKNDPEYTKILNRVSSLTDGMVTIKVGGSTHLDINEKIFRYEDAINAVRAAMKEGYLPGAGVAIYKAFQDMKVKPEYKRMFKALAEVNIRQIAENCGENPDLILLAIKGFHPNGGYNAVTGKVEDVVKAGIIEPYLVTSQVISNAVSIANTLVTSKYLFVNDLEEYNKNK